MRSRYSKAWPFLLTALLLSASAGAAELPEDRVELNYVRLDGGASEVSGPGLLVSKRLREWLAVTADYSSEHSAAAAVDLVLPDARPMNETRRTGRLAVDLGNDHTAYSVGVTRSDGDRYAASTAHATITQNLFSDLTTVTLGAGRGWDSAYHVLAVTGGRDQAFEGKAFERNWTLTVIQTLSRNASVRLDGEVITQEGYLANPNEAARVATTTGYALIGERTPSTRTRDAAALHLKYYLPWRAALTVGGRYHADTWGIRAQDWDLAYRQPFRHDRLLIEATLRHYAQSHAHFFSDLAATPPTGLISRDPTLAEFKVDSAGVSATFAFATPPFRLKKLTASLGVEGAHYRYADLRDPFSAGGAGAEALYRHAGILAQARLTGWF